MLEQKQGMLFKTLLRGEEIDTIDRFARAKRLLTSRVMGLHQKLRNRKKYSPETLTEEAVRLVLVCVLLKRQSKLEDKAIRQAGDVVAVEERGEEVDEEWHDIKESLHDAVCYLDSHKIYPSAWSYVIKIGLADEIPNVQKHGLNISS